MTNSSEADRSTPRHSVSVAGAVIREDGRVLAIRRADNGAWEPPGGVLEIHERPEDGVRREVREETGVEVEVERLSGVYKNLDRGVVALVFRCRAVGGGLRTTEESKDVAWLTPDEVSARMDEAYAVRLLDACADGSGPEVPVRSHDGARLVDGLDGGDVNARRAREHTAADSEAKIEVAIGVSGQAGAMPDLAVAPLHNIGHERELWDEYAESTKDKVLAADPVLCWTQYAGHGPGVELLGDPASALELGCGTGRAVAYLAQRGVTVTGVDLSPVMVKRITERWGPLGAEFRCAEVLEHLRADTTTYDAIYSIFGAVWFTDPAELLPLVRQRLNPGGVLVFSQPPAIPGAYGPQGMYKGGFAGRAMYTYRYSYTPEGWTAHLREAGFAKVDAYVLDAPVEGHIGTLIVRASVSAEPGTGAVPVGVAVGRRNEGHR
jgi:ADP-ribose pyrophosphatase YjhB (NUDIX family)/SAM-dependent methyltransferase